MLLKILTRKNIGGVSQLLKYIANHEKSNIGVAEVIKHNIRSRSISGQVKEFYNAEASRKYIRANTNKVLHEIISFSPESPITNDMLRDIAEMYIELRGERALMVGAFHTDGTNHKHIHFVVSGVEVVTGLSTHIPKPKLREIKQELQSYYLQKFPELEKSAVAHGKNKEYETDREYQAKQRTNKKLKREEIASIVREIFEQSKTQEEFLHKLTEANLPHYERGGEPKGIEMGERRYRFSRMEIPFADLVHDRTEEIALKEIRAIRKKISARERSHGIDR